jgi:hypothetical protein
MKGKETAQTSNRYSSVISYYSDPQSAASFSENEDDVCGETRRCLGGEA